MFNFEGRKAPVDYVILDTLSNQTCLQEDMDETAGGGPMRIGVQRKVKLSPVNCGRWTTLEDGSRVWRVAVQSPGARFVSLFFSHFRLPQGAEMYFYDATGYLVLGRYLSDDVKPDSTFFTQAIPGETVYIEYHIPQSCSDNGELLISELCHGYKDFLRDDMLPSRKGAIGNSEGNCHINIACATADNYRDQSHAVCCITISTTQGTYLCSGTLMNNTALDKTPYVLSAHHCQDITGTITRFTFYFNYESTTCSGSYGRIDQSITGADIVAKQSRSSGSDFLLLRLHQMVPDEYEPFYAGWDRSQVQQPTIGCCIHHPGGDLKKISIPYSVRIGEGSLLPYYRAQWNRQGVVEGGSSGSALFNKSGLVIGQLYGGTSSCTNASGPNSYDYYGRLAYSWTGGGSASSRLKDWLDPTNSGVNSLSGSYGDSLVYTVPTFQDTLLLSCFPNPSLDGMVSFEVDSPGEVLLQIYNTKGLLVDEMRSTFATNTQRIDLSHLQAGSYVVLLTQGDKTYHGVVVIARTN